MCQSGKCQNNTCIPAQSSSQPPSSSSSGTTSSKPLLENPLGNVKDLGTLLTNIIKFIISGIGLFAAGAIIYGGFLYVTSGGNEERVKLGKSAVTYGIIGLILAITARIIVEAVITAITVTT